MARRGTRYSVEEVEEKLRKLEDTLAGIKNTTIDGDISISMKSTKEILNEIFYWEGIWEELTGETISQYCTRAGLYGYN